MAEAKFGAQAVDVSKLAYKAAFVAVKAQITAGGKLKLTFVLPAAAGTAAGGKASLNPLSAGWPVRRLDGAASPPPPPLVLPDVVFNSPNVSSSDSSKPPMPRDPPAGGVDPLVDTRVFSLGGQPVEHGASGNCFFQSVVGSLDDPMRSHVEVRQLVVQHIREHPERYADWVPGDFSEYCDRMATDETYIEGGAEISAAAEVLNVNIYIFAHSEAYDRHILKVAPDQFTRNVSLVYYPDMKHYREFQRI